MLEQLLKWIIYFTPSPPEIIYFKKKSQPNVRIAYIGLWTSLSVSQVGWTGW